MSETRTSEMTDVLDRVRAWPADEQIDLAQRILQGVNKQLADQPARRRSLKNLLGVLRPDGEIPGDEECRKALEEELLEKYGS